MSFGQPFLLLSLLSIPLAIAFYLAAQRRKMRYAVRFTNLDVLAEVVASRRPWRRYVAPVVFLLALAALCVGMARPHVTKLVVTGNATVILVIDVSGSMHATDVKPSRLEAAQQAVRSFLDHAPKQLRVGLIAFAGEPQVAAPPTSDHTLVRQAVDTLDEFGGFGGTAIGDALALAVQLGQHVAGTSNNPGGAATIAFHPHGIQSPVSILFLSDGHQTRGALEPLEGAALAKTAHIPVYTVALGTSNGTLTITGGGGRFGGGGFNGGGFSRTVPVPPDPTTLRAIAQTTGGKFVEAQNAHTLQSAYSSLGLQLGQKRALSEVTNDFVLLAALLLIAAGLVAARWSPRLP